MATLIWTGSATNITEVKSVTPVVANIGDVFTLHVGAKFVTYTSTAATVANVTAGLESAWNASVDPEMVEATASDETTYLELSHDLTGVPFTVTATVTGAGASAAIATTTYGTGENYWDNPYNWDNAGVLGTNVPGQDDDPTFDGNSDTDCLYGLDNTNNDVKYLAYDAWVADFTIGQIITGGTSGAEGLIVFVNEWTADTDGVLGIKVYTGTYQDNEALTDPVGGSATSNGTVGEVWLDYNNEAGGPFTVGNVVTNATAGGTATLRGLQDDGAVGSMVLSEPTQDDWVTGDQLAEGGATADIDGDVDYRKLSILTIKQGYAGLLGLPAWNSNGYWEYRNKNLEVHVGDVEIGEGSGEGSGRIRLDTGDKETAVEVSNSGTGVDDDVLAIQLIANHADNTLQVLAGEIDLSIVVDGGASQFTTVDLNAGTLRAIGDDVDTTTLNMYGGTFESDDDITTVHIKGGSWTATDGNITTVNAENCNIDYATNDTITTLNMRRASAISFVDDPSAKVVTNCTMWAGSSVIDSNALVTFTNGILLSGCALVDITLDVGVNVTITPA